MSIKRSFAMESLTCHKTSIGEVNDLNRHKVNIR